MKSKYFFRYYVVLPHKNIMNNKLFTNDVLLVQELMSWFNKRWHPPQSKGGSNLEIKNR